MILATQTTGTPIFDLVEIFSHVSCSFWSLLGLLFLYNSF